MVSWAESMENLYGLVWGLFPRVLYLLLKSIPRELVVSMLFSIWGFLLFSIWGFMHDAQTQECYMSVAINIPLRNLWQVSLSSPLQAGKIFFPVYPFSESSSLDSGGFKWRFHFQLTAYCRLNALSLKPRTAVQPRLQKFVSFPTTTEQLYHSLDFSRLFNFLDFSALLARGDFLLLQDQLCILKNNCFSQYFCVFWTRSF